MGREVRRVPSDWQHPKDADGCYIPLHEFFRYTAEEIEEGLRDGWLTDEPPDYGVGVMPNWAASDRTHIQMYESTSEGTPISPVVETPEELALWLADNNASAFAGLGATREQWLSMINGGGYAPSAVMCGGRMISGVEGLHPSATVAGTCRREEST